MEFAKDEIFKIRYNMKLDKLEIGNKKGSTKIKNAIKNYKVIFIIAISVMILAIINSFMIYNFFKILQNI